MPTAAAHRFRPTSRLPRLSWPGWAERAAPVARFCATLRGRTWPELHTWAAARGLPADELVNLVAWLEEHGRLRGLGAGDRVRWVATGDETNERRPTP